MTIFFFEITGYIYPLGSLPPCSDVWVLFNSFAHYVTWYITQKWLYSTFRRNILGQTACRWDRLLHYFWLCRQKRVTQPVMLRLLRVYKVKIVCNRQTQKVLRSAQGYRNANIVLQGTCQRWRRGASWQAACCCSCWTLNGNTPKSPVVNMKLANLPASCPGTLRVWLGPR